MAENHLYDEDKELSLFWSWVIIIAFTLSIIGWGLLVYLFVQDGRRYWDFGQLPDTPAENIYSTQTPPVEKKPPQQISPLPEAQPKNPPKPRNVPLRERSSP